MLLYRASPEIAAYPFTTLMPNLGVLASGKPRTELQDEFSDLDFMVSDSSSSNMSTASGPVLADMPGLIQVLQQLLWPFVRARKHDASSHVGLQTSATPVLE